MAETLVGQLADFTADISYASLPAAVAEEAKRVILDSLGCALAGVDHPKGKIGVEYARLTGGPGDATIIGTGQRSSIAGAAYANGELINALDYDAIIPPGHVTPYVLPGILAVGEQSRVPGRDVIAAVALAHEMAYRIGRAMDYMWVVQDGKMVSAPVIGFSAPIFGAAAGIGKVRKATREVTANALAIAASISPVNSDRAWVVHAPCQTNKYTPPGVVNQSAIAAAYSAELGHVGDHRILDDREAGYPRFIGTSQWQPDKITDGLGADWLFPSQLAYKIYPHCGILRSPLDALTEIVERNDIQPDEIEGIHVWGDPWTLEPVWLNRRIEHVMHAQFSMPHGLAVGAQRIEPGRDWHDPDLIFSPSVLALMDKVTYDPHPANVIASARQGGAWPPARVEVSARGTTFTAERGVPKGAPSDDPATALTTAELAEKFRRNAERVLSASTAESVVEAVLTLEDTDDIGIVMRAVGAAAQEFAE